MSTLIHSPLVTVPAPSYLKAPECGEQAATSVWLIDDERCRELVEYLTQQGETPPPLERAERVTWLLALAGRRPVGVLRLSGDLAAVPGCWVRADSAETEVMLLERAVIWRDHHRAKRTGAQLDG